MDRPGLPARAARAAVASSRWDDPNSSTYTETFLSKNVSSLFAGHHLCLPPLDPARCSGLGNTFIIKQRGKMDYRSPMQSASYPTAAKSAAARAPRQMCLPFAACNTQQLWDCHPVILCRRQMMSGCLNVTNSAKPVFFPSYSFLDAVLKASAYIIPSPKTRMHTDKLGNQIPCRRY